MVFVVDDLGAWLVALLADAGRKRLTTVLLGSDQQRALRRAASNAVKLTATELHPYDGEAAAELAMVVNEVFGEPLPVAPLAMKPTLLEALQAGLAGQLAPLDDPSLTGAGESAAAVLGVPASVLAQKLTGHLVREIVVRGARGGPLAPLAAQLNHDKAQLQGQRIEDILGRLDNEVRKALTRLDNAQAVRAAPVLLAQLPPVPAGFTGRDHELAVLAGLLDPAGTAQPVLVSAVAGLAGVGKTTLAIQAGHAATEKGWFGGGVLFIDLHGYDEAPVQPSQALDALLRALRVPAEDIPPTVEERAGLYRSVLARIGEPVLVTADNASSEAQVKPLLPGAGAHKVLVTSRQTLAGLGARLVDVTVLDEAASIALLEGALRAARPDDDRIGGDPETAERLAGLCGGLPLALQITAALLKADPALSAAELADQLSDENDRLAALRYDDGSGQSAPSVAAAFELSYHKLDDTAARVFRLLPVSPGPDVSTDSAGVLSDLPAGEVRRVLAGLAAAHLIETAPGRPGRWRMHDLVRLYARRLSDQDTDAGAREQARDRLLDYYLTMADAADDHLRALPGAPVPDSFTGRDEALAWLDAERSSLVAADDMAFALGRNQIAFGLSIALFEYLARRRYVDESIATAAVGLDAARRLSDLSLEAAALNNLGLAFQAARRFDEAVSAHQDAAPVFRAIGDRRNEGAALFNLATALVSQRLYDQAITAYRQDLEICREAGDRYGEGKTLNGLSVCLREMGQFSEAIAASQDAAAILREIGDRDDEAIVLHDLAGALSKAGRLDEAVTASQEAAAIFRETADRHGEGMALVTLAGVLHSAQRFDEAITASQEAAAIFRETGDRHGEAMALNNLSGILLLGTQLDEAIAASQEAAAMFRETADRHAEGGALANLATALWQVQRYEEAVDAYQGAAAIFRETGDQHAERKMLDQIHDVQLEMLPIDEAISVYQDEVAAFREAGERQREGNALDKIGTALWQAQRFDEAISIYQEVVAIFHETGDQYDEGMALGKLRATLVAGKQLDQAIAANQAAAAIFREIGEQLLEGMMLVNLGTTLMQAQRFDEAISAYQDAAVIFRETGDRHGEAMVQTNIGIALWQAQRFDEAISNYQDAAAIFRETGDRHGEGTALTSLGAPLQAVGRFEEAITACQDAAAIHRETGDRHGEGTALGKLGSALLELGRFEDTITAFQDAAAMFREAGDHDSERTALDDLEAARAAQRA